MKPIRMHFKVEVYVRFLYDTHSLGMCCLLVVDLLNILHHCWVTSLRNSLLISIIFVSTNLHNCIIKSQPDDTQSFRCSCVYLMWQGTTHAVNCNPGCIYDYYDYWI